MTSGLAVLPRQAKRAVRTWQTLFPGLVDLKFDAQRLLRNALRYPFERDFRALPLLLGGLGRPPLVVDVGANRGQSIDAVRLFFPDAEIHAFEPNPVLYERLRRRHAAEADRVRLHNLALASRPDELELHVPSYNGFVFDGLASLSEQEARSWLSPETLVGFRASRLKVDRFAVRAATLDSLGLAPDLVKIDVQGTEAEVVRGGLGTLRRARPALLVELEGPSRGCRALLEGEGYVQLAFRGDRLTPGRGAMNSFFVHRSSPPGVAALGLT